MRDYGVELRDAVRDALQDVVPKFYAKFDLATVPIRSGDARRIIESDTLAGLPAAYYEGGDGLGLIRRHGGDLTIDPDRPATAEVLDFIRNRRSYGEEAAGKALENRFTAFGYGWDLEIVMLLAATLLRAGSIEVYSGRRYTSYADAGVRDVFRSTPGFRGARFSPRQGPIDFQKLTECPQAIERLYGVEVHIEEGAIANAGPADLACHVVDVPEAVAAPGEVSAALPFARPRLVHSFTCGRIRESAAG